MVWFLRTFIRRSPLLCALALLLAAPALAQTSPPIAASESGLSVELAGHRVTVPPPVWSVAGTEPVAQAQTMFTVLADGVESLVLLPPDATVVTWRTLMGILVVGRPGYSAATQLASIVDPISTACMPGAFEASTVAEAGKGGVLLLCGRYRPNATDVPGRCGGGIILGTVLEGPGGAAKVYHEWCTTAFDAANRETWPVSEASLLQHAEALIALSSLVPLAPPLTSAE